MSHVEPIGEHHGEIWDLLPWYANSTLSEAERHRVETHVESCEECARELSFLSGLGTAMRDEPPLLLSPERSLAAVGERIDALEAARRGRLDWRDIAHMVGAKLAGARLGVRPALAAVVLAVAIGAVWVWSGVSDPTFRTLTSESGPVAESSVSIRLVFTGSATVDEVQALLHRLDLTLIAGPSTYGVYTARPAGEADATRLDRVVTELREHPRVAFAEPIAGPAPSGGRE